MADETGADVDTNIEGNPPADPAPADDWRAEYAGDNTALLNEMSKTTDIKDYINTTHSRLAEAQTQLRNRDENSIKILGEDAGDDERAAFNEKLGIPKEAGEYKIDVEPPQGLEVSDADKAMLERVTSKLFESGGFAATPATINAAHAVYYDAMQEAAAQAEVAAIQAQEATVKELKSEWGTDYKNNMRLAQEAMKEFGSIEDAQEFMGIQLADGSLLGDNAQFLRTFARFARTKAEDPLFAQVLENADTSVASLEDKIDGIMKLYRSTDPKDREKYNSPETQKELDDLLQAQERLKAG